MLGCDKLLYKLEREVRLTGKWENICYIVLVKFIRPHQTRSYHRFATLFLLANDWELLAAGKIVPRDAISVPIVEHGQAGLDGTAVAVDEIVGLALPDSPGIGPSVEWRPGKTVSVGTPEPTVPPSERVKRRIARNEVGQMSKTL